MKGKDGILEEWNDGSLRHTSSFYPVFQDSIIPFVSDPSSAVALLRRVEANEVL
jgi:hypothetical protein